MKTSHSALLTAMAFCLAGFVPAHAGDEPKDTQESKGNFILSAEIRERGLYTHGYKALLGPDEKGNFFVGQRVRLNFGYQKDNLGFYVQAQDTRVWGETTGSTGNGLGISQAYFYMDFAKRFGFKVGRMPLHYEDGRYFSYSNWDEAPRTHDALFFNFRSLDKRTKVDLGASFSNNSESYVLNPYQLDNYFKYLLIGYVSHQFVPDFRLSILSVTDFQERLYIEEGENKIDPSRLYARSTVGLYLDILKTRKVSLLLYGYGQFGKLNTGQETIAGMASFKLKYKALPVLDFQLAYDFVSGWTMSGDYNSGFDKFLGSTHSFLGIMDFFSPQGSRNATCLDGLHQPYLSITYRPAPKHSLEFGGRYFWTVEDPEFVLREDFDSFKTYDSHNLGFEGSLIYKYQILPELGLEAGYAFHTATPVLELCNLIRPDQSKFAHFGYVMITYKPTLFNLDKHLAKHDD